MIAVIRNPAQVEKILRHIGEWREAADAVAKAVERLGDSAAVAVAARALPPPAQAELRATLAAALEQLGAVAAAAAGPAAA